MKDTHTIVHAMTRFGDKPSIEVLVDTVRDYETGDEADKRSIGGRSLSRVGDDLKSESVTLADGRSITGAQLAEGLRLLGQKIDADDRQAHAKRLADAATAADKQAKIAADNAKAARDRAEKVK